MKICVFCSSGNQIAESYKQATFRFGKNMAEQGHTLVYGGATGGLMDAIAEGFTAGMGKIIGVIPEIIIHSDRLSNLPTTLIQTADMAERKKRMFEESDVFVVLPGGYGTLDEMFTIIASGAVGEHQKPLICVNQDGFFKDLLELIDKMKGEFFIPKNENYKPIFVNSLSDCERLIDSDKLKLRT
ncbi:MAG: TIGR00730 family Rossman fold protein [Paludibacteraceae bacterium]